MAGAALAADPGMRGSCSVAALCSAGGWPNAMELEYRPARQSEMIYKNMILNKSKKSIQNINR